MWYAKVPKGELENLQWRVDVLRQGAESRRTRDWLRAACADDTHFFFNGFLWTFDPRLRGHRNLPLVTFPIQDAAIERIENSIEYGRDIQIEKSRDLGASVICTGVFFKRWCFGRDESYMMFGRDEDEVDKPGYPGCLFWKIDWNIRHVPGWLLPEGFEYSKHRRKFVLESPETNTTINGEAMVPDGGVGDRKRAILIDEFSRIQYADDLDLGTADATDCRIFNFTAFGENNAADRMRRSGVVRKVVMHWTMDPRKNKKLYRWNGDTQRLEYYEYVHGEGEPVMDGGRELILVRRGPHKYGPEDDWRDEGDKVIRFEPVKDGWVRSPKYDAEEYRRRSPKWMAINWRIDYVSSENKFFEGRLLQELMVETVRDPLWVGDLVIDEETGELLELIEKPDGPLKLWLELGPDNAIPTSERGYGAGSDVARGAGATNSCFSLGNVDNGHKVLEYVTPFLTVEKYAKRCVALCRAFQSDSGVPAKLAWEKLGPGEDFRRTVKDLGYTNVYYEHGKKHRRGLAAAKETLPGWSPTAKTRADLFGEYQVSLRERRCINRSRLALLECNDFLDTPRGCYYKTVKTGKNAVSGEDSGATCAHGDRVTADALMNRAMIDAGRPQLERAEKAVSPDAVFGNLWYRVNEHRRQANAAGRFWG